MVFTVGGFLLSIFASFYSFSAEDSTQGLRCVRQEPHHKDTPPAHFHFLHLQISCFSQSKHVIHSHGNSISGGKLATAVQGVPQAHSWEQQHWTTSGSGHSAWCFHFQRVSGSSFPPASRIIKVTTSPIPVDEIWLFPYDQACGNRHVPPTLHFTQALRDCSHVLRLHWQGAESAS